MLMFGLNEPIDQLAMANSEHCHGHVSKEDGHVLKEDGHVLKEDGDALRALDFEGQMKKRRAKKKWKQVETKA